MKPETRARVEAEARLLSDELHLSQLRKARGLTQEAMAELVGVSQAEVSKMERRFADGVEVPLELADTDAV